MFMHKPTTTVTPPPRPVMTLYFIVVLAVVMTLLPVGAARAQWAAVCPRPHDIAPARGGTAQVHVPDRWRMVCDTARSRGMAALVHAAMPHVVADDTVAFTVTLAVRGDRTARRLQRRVPRRAEAYRIEAAPGGIAIAASDMRGLGYALQTLAAATARGMAVEAASVTDWPDVARRGTVEGFYGTPWSHEARLRQIEFYGRHRLNTYIYGPKDDPYHRRQWRDPYPEAEAQRIASLAAWSQSHGVDFCWAIHPGLDIRWDEADRHALVAKLESVYRLGVRSFAVFFDDISGDGADPARQADLLNYVNAAFVHRHSGTAPLLMCPTVYNRAWSTDGDSYLRTLGTRLDRDIDIMWTGNAVVADIDREGMEWINSRIGRKAFVWYNYPVSDYVRDRVLLGPAYGNGTDLAGSIAGFVANLMEHAEASKIALYGIAAYAWHMQAYDADECWQRAIADLLPHNAAALHTFALYNKDLGANGHGYRREEGGELLLAARQATGGNADGIDSLRRACSSLLAACDTLLTDSTDRMLIGELRPWLLQGRNVACYGMAVCDMALAEVGTDLGNDADLGSGADTIAVLAYRRAVTMLGEMRRLSADASVCHPHQPGIKVGTRVLLPTLHKLLALSVQRYNATHDVPLAVPQAQLPFAFKSDVPQLASLPLTAAGDTLAVSPPNEIVRWQTGGSMTIEATQNVIFTAFTLDLGSAAVVDALKLELYTNGQWRTIGLVPSWAGSTEVCADAAIGDAKASRLRVTNTSGHDIVAKLGRCSVVTK